MTTLLVIVGLLAAIWGTLVLYLAAGTAGPKRYRWAVKEGTSLLLGSFVVIVLLGVAIAGKSWLTERLNLDRQASKTVGALLAFALVIPAWIAWSSLRARRQQRHHDDASTSADDRA